MVQITDVTPKTPAARAGIKPGDILLTIDGHVICDVLDYRFYSTEPHLDLTVHRESEILSFSVEKQEYEDLGLCFATPLMDKKQRCQNGCIFCFIDQLPKGMRDTLYFKDDDTRLSFLHGNYVTLTNLTEADIDRIIEMRISPVNVSIHTTDPELRIEMMRNKKAGEVLSYLRKLADAGISLQGQIVLCRGINDGEHLRRSLVDLATYYPALESVSVVPVGLSDHREGLYPLTPFTEEDAKEVLSLVNGIGEENKKTLGTRLVYCADEWYLKAGQPIPEEDYYEGYPQIENGVGMLRSLMTEVETYLSTHSIRRWKKRHVSIVTGVAAADTMRYIALCVAKKCPRIQIDVYPIVNHFFGEKITVAGLLTGKDIIAQLQGKDLGEMLLLPADALRADEDVLLDDVTVKDLCEALSVPVVPTAGNGEQLIYNMCYLPKRTLFSKKRKSK